MDRLPPLLAPPTPAWLSPRRIGVATGCIGTGLAIAAEARTGGASPFGALLFMLAAGLIVGGACRATSARWAALLSVIGAVPAGLLVGALFPEVMVDVGAFRARYLAAVGLLGSQATLSVLALRERPSDAVDRSLSASGLWLLALGGLLTRAPLAAGVAALLGALSIAVALGRDLRRASFLRSVLSGSVSGLRLLPLSPGASAGPRERGGELGELWCVERGASSDRAVVVGGDEAALEEARGPYRGAGEGRRALLLVPQRPGRVIVSGLLASAWAGAYGALSALVAVALVAVSWGFLRAFELALSPFG